MTDVKMHSDNDKTFLDACRVANCKPTARQYRKWLKGTGVAGRVKTGKAEPLVRNHPAYKG